MNNRFICEWCNKETTTKRALHNHIEICKEKLQAEINSLKNELNKITVSNESIKFVKLEEENKYLKLHIKQTEDQHNKQLQEKDNQINELRKLLQEEKERNEKELKFRESLIKATGNVNVVCNTMTNNTLKYIAANCTAAPEFKSIEGTKSMQELEKKSIEGLIYLNESKKLDQKLGDLIINNYYQKDPKKQSVFCTDVSRFSYITRELNKNKALQWTVDKKGIEVGKKAINPLIKIIQRVVDKYMSQEITDLDEYKKVLELSEEINNKKLKDSIHRYISPHFAINSRQNEITNNDENNDEEIIVKSGNLEKKTKKIKNKTKIAKKIIYDDSEN
jgi:hypothetical protein